MTLERRPPTAIARKRETSPNNAPPRRPPTAIARKRETSPNNAWSAGLRPASRGSAKPAPTTLERRPPTAIARKRETSPNNATPHQRQYHPRSESCKKSAGTPRTWNAGLRPPSRGSAKPAPTTLERWPPTGIARQRETSTNNAAPRRPPTAIARQRETSTNNAPPHRPPTAIARKRETSPNNAGAPASSPGGGLRPASRGSAKPAPTTLDPHRQYHPASDRHRAAARNQRQQRMERRLRPASPARNPPTTWRRPPTAIARQRETSTNNALDGAPVSDRHRAAARNQHQQRWPVLPPAGLRPASRGSAKPAPTTLERRRRPPTGIARERETSTDDAGALASSPPAGLRPASRGSAKPAPTTTLERWPVLPVGASDRHRAGARNQRQQRWSAGL